LELKLTWNTFRQQLNCIFKLVDDILLLSMEKETTQDSKTTIPEVQSEPKEDLQPVTQDPETQQISPEVVMDSESVINQPVKNKNKLLMIILVLLLILIGAGGFLAIDITNQCNNPLKMG